MYKPPRWCTHSAHDCDLKDVYLEVVKKDEAVDRIDLCDKSYYLVGRNSDVCDIVAEHQSLSRIHAAFVFHPGMKKFFLHDNNAVHGTFINKTRLSREPKALSYNAKITFGASTRTYVLKRGGGHVSDGAPVETLNPEMQRAVLMGRLSLPDDQTELDTLTESNTRKNLKASVHEAKGPYNPAAHIASASRPRKKRVSFAEKEQIVNMADIDDRVGRFSNLVSSTVVVDGTRKKSTSTPAKRQSLGLLESGEGSALRAHKSEQDYENEENGSDSRLATEGDAYKASGEGGVAAEEAALLRKMAAKRKYAAALEEELSAVRPKKISVDATPVLD